MTNNLSHFSANTPPVGFKVCSQIKSLLVGIAQAFTSIFHRSDSLSILSRQSVLGLVLVFLTLGVGNVWGTDATATFSSASFSVGGWSKTSNTSIQGYDNGVQVTWNSINSTSLVLENSDYSSYTIKTVKLNYRTNGNSGSASVKVGSSTLGSTVSLSSSSNTDATFSNATGLTGNKITITVTSSATKKSLYVNSIKITYETSGGTKYTVNYDANGGSVSPSSHTQASAGAAITTPTPTRAGYNCTGWYTATSGGTKRCNAGASYTPTATETVHAQWSCIEPTINTQPASANYAVGASPAALSVSATLSSGTLTYLWKVSTNGGSTWSNASGTNNQATYAAANISTASAGTTKYKCIVTNSSGSCSTESDVATITVYTTHKAYFYNGSTLLNTGGTDVAEGAAVTYSGSNPSSCDDGEGASDTFVGWATGTWSDKKAAKGNIPGGITFYDITASETLPNMSTSDVTYYAVFAKVTESAGGGNTTILSEAFTGYSSDSRPSSPGSNATKLAGSNMTYTWNPNSNTGSRVMSSGGPSGGSTGNNIIIQKSSGYLQISSVPSNDKTSVTLSYRKSGGGTLVVSSTTTGVSIGNATNDGTLYTHTISIPANTSTFVLKFTNSDGSGGSNLRVDDISITHSNTVTTYSNYLTTCCTPLGSINGSINMTTLRRFFVIYLHHVKGHSIQFFSTE